MSYLSLEFFSAFVLFLGLYWLFAFSPRLQNLLLIAASYGIVASFNIDGTHFEYILLAYTLAVYVVSHIISRCRLKIINNMLVVVLVCSLLFVFKYYNFFLDVFQTALFNVGINPGLSPLSLLLPIGISFYSFHSASYLVSVKNKQIPPAPILDLVLYLCFFPSIIAGPINRATDFLAQIQNPSLRCVLDVRRALLLIAVAIGKLLLLSSWLAINFANPVFSSPSLYSPGQVLLGVYAYAFQIYFNFSGYTDLVTAMALLLGFRLPKNFDFPYLAQEVPMSLGITTVQAPLGLILIALTALMAIVFIAYVIAMQGAWLLEARAHSKEMAAQRKLEAKDELRVELRDELATKEDMANLKAEFAKLEGQMGARFERMDKKFTLLFAITIFTVIFLNQNALEFLARIFGLLK